MSAPEQEILDRLLQRLDRLHLSVADDIAWLERPPSDLAEFATMASHRRSASRAVLKSFEQLQDQLARTFRVIPKMMGQDTLNWTARDHGDFMEKQGVFDDAADWSRVVKLRNQLVHDYPLDEQLQFDRLIQVLGLLPLLSTTYGRLNAFVRTDLPGKVLD